MKCIRVAIVGIGNCASSLVQGISYYRQNASREGLIHSRIGGYGVENLEIVAAFDVDERKVGLELGAAIFSAPNNTFVFHRDIPFTGVKVSMVRVLYAIGRASCRERVCQYV